MYGIKCLGEIDKRKCCLRVFSRIPCRIRQIFSEKLWIDFSENCFDSFKELSQSINISCRCSESRISVDQNDSQVVFFFRKEMDAAFCPFLI